MPQLYPLGIGVGVQNYTCSATTSTYTSTGAVAQLYDISCAVGAFSADQISTAAFDAWKAAPSSMTIQQVIAGSSKVSFRAPFSGVLDKLVLGQHYFVPNPTGAAGLSPMWDFRSSGLTKGKTSAFVIGAKDASLNAVNNAADVPLLQLHGIQGNLATSIYRVATKGGQAPTSCTPGTPDISVKYVAQYGKPFRLYRHRHNLLIAVPCRSVWQHRRVNGVGGVRRCFGLDSYASLLTALCLSASLLSFLASALHLFVLLHSYISKVGTRIRD
jgi:hypothetical protein